MSERRVCSAGHRVEAGICSRLESKAVDGYTELLGCDSNDVCGVASHTQIESQLVENLVQRACVSW